MPKEARNSKSEAQPGLDKRVAEASAFWNWGGELGVQDALLHDGPAAERLPPSDLMERTAQFGEAIIRFAKRIPHSIGNNRLIDQLVGAGTSIGANYAEADDAVSGKDLKHRYQQSNDARRPTPGVDTACERLLSVFGFLSDFGFRISDLAYVLGTH